MNVTNDEEAIKKVITDATDAFRTRNFDKIATTYVQDETLIKTGAAKGGFAVNEGWSEVSENYKTSFKNNPETVPGKLRFIKRAPGQFTTRVCMEIMEAHLNR